MSKAFYVVGEVREGKLRQVSLEALQTAQLLSQGGMK